MTWRAQVEAVRRHPILEGLGTTATDQARAEAFAWDLSSWLPGEPEEELGPLARVVATVAVRELGGPRRLCAGRPLLAVEAGARATRTLWPHLRAAIDEPDEPDEPNTPPDPAGPPDPDTPPDPTGPPDPDGPQDPDGLPDPTGPPEPDESPDPDNRGHEAPGPAEDAGPTRPADEAPPERPGASPAGVAADLERERRAVQAHITQILGATADPVLDSAWEGALAMAGSMATRGAAEAAQLASLAERFLPGVGWGTAPARVHQRMLERLHTTAALLDHLGLLRELAEELGRVEGAGRGREPLRGGGEEVTGVRMSGEVTRALPSELALLADPETEDLFYQRWIEHRLVSLELTGAGIDGSGAPDHRGPVIAAIDTSGSMRGPAELAAKALVLALCRRLLPQGRVVHLLLFGGPGDLREIRIRRGGGGLEDLLGFLALAFHGGTDFSGPLARAAVLLEERELRRADVLVVTDGYGGASEDTIARLERARQRLGARVWSVVVGTRRTSGVEPFSDRVLVIDPHDAARAAEAVRLP